VLSERLGEPALPDAGLPGDQHHHAAPGECSLHQRQELGELSLAAHQPLGFRNRLGRPRGLELGVLREDRRLQVPQRAARLDPELLDQRAPGVAVDLERLSLATRPVEGEHQLPP
jgi:hypothetical protein